MLWCVVPSSLSSTSANSFRCVDSPPTVYSLKTRTCRRIQQQSLSHLEWQLVDWRTWTRTAKEIQNRLLTLVLLTCTNCGERSYSACVTVGPYNSVKSAHIRTYVHPSPGTIWNTLYLSLKLWLVCLSIPAARRELKCSVWQIYRHTNLVAMDDHATEKSISENWASCP